MGLGDDITNGAENLVGKAKEAVGTMTDNDKLVAEGKADQVKVHAKDAASGVKDAGTDIGDALTGK